jgi:hypothetical protein
VILGVKDGPVCDVRLVYEVSAMRYRWGYFLDVDPAYGPNLDFDGGGFSLAERPRIGLPWVSDPKG